MSVSGGFAPTEIADGLWRWTAAHPGWQPGPPESTADWPREVGSLLVQSGDAAVFIDAQLPDPADAFFAWADPRIKESARAMALTTIRFHRRSRDRLVERYAATTSRARSALPPEVEPRPLRGAGEVAFWLSRQRALVPGDSVLGAPGGGLRLCPQSWLGYLSSGLTLARMRELLRPLLELPIERVLVSHGEPVLGDGRRALAAALR